jgi:tetratricopeptide (TPR) repeat protein
MRSSSASLSRGLLCLQLALAFASGGCGDRSAADSAAFKKDQAAVAAVSQIAATINSSKTVTPESFDALKKIREKYPYSPEVANAFKGALIARGDWDALEAFLRERPAGELPPEDKVILGRVLLKTGKYDEAVRHLSALIADSPADIDVRGLLAEAMNYRGEYDAAEKQIAAVWNEIVVAKRADLMILRGTILSNQDQFAKAEEFFLAALAADPDSLGAASGLSRTYQRLGNGPKAEEFRLKAVEIGKRLTDREVAARRRVEKIYALETAWNSKRFQDVIALCNELVQASADVNEKLVLYRYLFESHSALGNRAEAENARSEALRLQQK